MGNFKISKGFTLVELLVVVAIIGILVKIAYPNYTNYIKKSRRTAAQSEMLNIANREEQFLLANRQYADKATIIASGYGLPASLTAFYTYDVVPTNSSTASPTYLITFTAIGAQTSDGNLTLDNQGVKTPSAKWN